MPRQATRDHVFSLTDDEKASIDLWDTRQPPDMGLGEFASNLGISCGWFSNALRKRMEIAAIDNDPDASARRYGFSSLAKSHGVKRMVGTK